MNQYYRLFKIFLKSSTQFWDAEDRLLISECVSYYVFTRIEEILQQRETYSVYFYSKQEIIRHHCSSRRERSREQNRLSINADLDPLAVFIEFNLLSRDQTFLQRRPNADRSDSPFKSKWRLDIVQAASSELVCFGDEGISESTIVVRRNFSPNATRLVDID